MAQEHDSVAEMSDIEEEGAGVEPVQLKPAARDIERDVEMTYDLGNLVAFDPTPVQLSGGNLEDNLRAWSRDNVQLLVNQIFSLPTEQAEDNSGALAVLPEPSTKIPRMKPVPKPKPPTKWELFARQKGIQKRKRGRMVFDEATQTWKPRWGYGRAVKDQSQDWVIEAKPGDDGSIDPWTKMEMEKKERVAKNKKQQLRNLKAATGNRAPGTIDLTSAAGLTPSKKGKTKSHVDVALQVAQRSTASMGKFDPHRPAEPARKPERQQKRDELQFNSAAERAQNLSVLNRVLGKTPKESERFDAEKAANQALQAVSKKASKKGSKKKR